MSKRYNSYMSHALPLHIKITELLIREISAGRWQTGERLPSEAALSNTLGVAIGTLRKALAELEQQGVITRKQGSGTYVQAALPNKSIYDLFKLELIDGGGLPTAQLISLNVISPNSADPCLGETHTVKTENKSSINTHLALEVSPVRYYQLRRVRYLNQTPIALEEIYFDTRHKQGIQASDLTEALYQFYQHSLGFWIATVEDAIGVSNIPSWAPNTFPLEPGQSCGFIRRLAWSGEDRLEEFSYTWFNPATAHYLSKLK